MIRKRFFTTLILAGLAGLSGCRQNQDWDFKGAQQTRKFRQTALDIEYPNVESETDAVQAGASVPRTLEDLRPEDFWNMTLEEAVQISLQNSKVINDIGGRVVQTPATMNTVYDPAITESNPQFGVEAALSAFDAQLQGAATWSKTDRPINAAFAGIFLPLREADAAATTTQVSKRTATGSSAAWRYNVNYDWNNSPTNLFPSAWTNAMEVEMRQPFLQGAGVEFNRINGPNGLAAGQTTGLGALNGFSVGGGVLIARINTDISLAQFETAVRNLVSDVENAYWDLYFAYRDLDAKVQGRDSALETWRKIEALARAGARGGEADKEAQAREQYYRFRGLVENALAGLPNSSTTTGPNAGLFRAAGGVYSRENNLRFLIGLPPSDGRLIRTVDEPTTARVEFDWSELVSESLVRRVELRRQKWVIKSRELQLVAARNFLMPRLDGSALYRWYGFGDDYLNLNGSGGFNNAVQNLTDGNFQEWQLGVQLNVPLGYRQAYAGVRNAELQLARERAILRDQELRITHDLAASVRELERSYQLTRTNFNRRIASYHEVKAVQDAYDAGTTTLDVLLDAQRRAAEAESDYFRSLVEHTLAIKSVHFEKGSLLEYSGVNLAEGSWTPKAYRDANYLAHKLKPKHVNYLLPGNRYKLGNGVYDQGDGETVAARPVNVAPDVDAAPTPAGEPGKLPPAAPKDPEATDPTARKPAADAQSKPTVSQAVSPAAQGPVVRAAATVPAPAKAPEVSPAAQQASAPQAAALRQPAATAAEKPAQKPTAESAKKGAAWPRSLARPASPDKKSATAGAAPAAAPNQPPAAHESAAPKEPAVSKEAAARSPTVRVAPQPSPTLDHGVVPTAAQEPATARSGSRLHVKL